MRERTLATRRTFDSLKFTKVSSGFGTAVQDVLAEPQEKASPEPEALVPRLEPCRDCPKSSATTPWSGSLLLQDGEWELLPLDRKDGWGGGGLGNPTYTLQFSFSVLVIPGFHILTT